MIVNVGIRVRYFPYAISAEDWGGARNIAQNDAVFA